MKMWKRWKAVLLAGMMACTAVAASVPAIGTLNAQAEEDTNNDDWLHAVGSRLYDKDGNEVWLTGANWFGMNCTENSPHGLYAADINVFVENIANHGINIVRMPISTELLCSWMNGEPLEVKSMNCYANPELSKNGDGKDPAKNSMKEDIEKCIWRANEFGEFETSALKINSQVATDEDKEEFIAILKDGQDNR